MGDVMKETAAVESEESRLFDLYMLWRRDANRLYDSLREIHDQVHRALKDVRYTEEER